jgi:hypothetical protein
VQDIVNIPIVRYDELSLPRPDLIFMDAQGSEDKILRGFGDLLNATKYVCFETSLKSSYINAANFEEIHKFMLERGFKFVACNMSGPGIFKFRIMQIRGILFSLRKSKGRQKYKYQSFFDVLYLNKRIRSL